MLSKPKHPFTFTSVALVGASTGAFLLSPVLSQPVQAYPTGNPFPGPTGLGVIPTTDTVTPGSIEASLNYERFNYAGVEGHAQEEPLATLSYGFHRGELGAVYTREKTDVLGFKTSNDYFALHGKYRIYQNDKGLQVAIGAHYFDFGSDGGIDLGNVTTVYGTGSLMLGHSKATGSAQGRLHAGVMFQHSKAAGDSESVVRPFVGAELFLSPEWSLAADYLDKDKDVERAMTIAARFQPRACNFSGQIGIGRINRDTKIFAGISYSFGGHGGNK